jgi:aspartyl/asparaginyl beta-hydroxylase (cupin superfamily)
MAGGYVLAKKLRKLIEKRIHGGEPSAVLSSQNFPWTRLIEARHREIRDEAEALLLQIAQITNFDDVLPQQRALSQKDAWKSYFLKALRRDVERHQISCPVTTEALRHVPGLINAFFSILQPGVEIPPHRGPYAGILRYHFGVIIPLGDLGMHVNGELCRWTEGKSLIFDDSFEHEAWNRTSFTRVILFVDFERPLRRPLRYFNRFVLKLFELSSAARAAHQRILAGQLEPRTY